MSDLLSSLQRALVGRYTVEREIGRGGMATVFLAQDERLARRVALKVLSPDVSVALGAERFQREIEIASKLTHPNIVPLYDSGEADGALFYAMPFIDGESLRARLDRERQLPLDEAIRIATEIAGALDYAHRHGVLHRDVKPANILLEDGHAVIADFGIARALTRAAEGEKLTGTGVTLGTPTYMSPEQASGEQNLDGRSDVYALGCVVYEMIAGQPPFTGPNAQAVLARHAMDTVPSLRVVRSTIPEHVEDAILCALSKAPADRFTTAQQFADALNGNVTATMKWQTMSRLASRGRLRRTALAVVAGAIAVLGAGGTIAVLGSGSRWPSGGADAGLIAPDRTRVAVMYFQDLSRDGRLGHVADGFSVALMDELSTVPRLQVVSANGVERFRGTTDFSAVGNELGAGTIVSGEVESIGDRMRVTVRLLDGASGADMGARSSFELPADQLLIARDSLVQEAARLLRERLGTEIRADRVRIGTRNVEAWSLVQRAEQLRRDAVRMGDADSLAAARRAFATADSLLALAESLDPAWSVPPLERGVVARRQLGVERNPLRMVQLIDTGIAHATRALAIDRRNADAFELRGSLRFVKQERGFATNPAEAAALVPAAAADLDSAIRINPAQAGAWYALSQLRYRQYDKRGGYDAAQQAYQADAFLESAREVLWRLAATAYDLEYWVAARDWCAQGRSRYPADPLFVRCQLWLLTSRAVEDPDIAEAWRLSARLDSLAPPAARELLRRESQMIVAAVIGRQALRDRADGLADSAAIKMDSARRVLDRAHVEPSEDPHGSLVGIEAAMRTIIGDKDAAITLLERFLVANPVHREGFVKNTTWWWTPLQDDPRFKALVNSR